MADNTFGAVVQSLLNGLSGYATAKTAIGEPVTVNDTILIPLVDVSIGVAAGAALNEEKKKTREGGGMGAKLSPSAILVIKDGCTRVINIKNQTTAMKLLDMVPEVINRFTGKTKIDDAETAAAVDSIKSKA